MDGITSVLNRPTGPAADSRAAAASTQLTDDFDQFLTLLTTQLQNQDPLEPMDSSEFTNQLVQFTSVEQQIATNTNLENLLSAIQLQSDGALLGYLGKEVVAQTNIAALTEDGAQWFYDLGADAEETTLTIRDERGQVVASVQGSTDAGIHELQWDGVDLSGNQLSSGLYTLQVEAVTVDGIGIATTSYIRGVASELDQSQGAALLKVNGVSLSPQSVLSVREPNEPENTTSIQ
ncbi:MAG: flagellar hook capping FlgD N-terminal domain-containing protein [Pseudomonadota bacterium]